MIPNQTPGGVAATGLRVATWNLNHWRQPLLPIDTRRAAWDFLPESIGAQVALVQEAVPPLAELVEAGEPIFSGGPVEPGGVIVLADFVDPSVADVIALGTIGFLPPEAEDLREGIRRARVFAGYAGWGPGQLEHELRLGGWLVLKAEPDDAFTANPETLW